MARSPLTPLQLVLLGKGPLRKVKPLGGNKWLGATEGHKYWPFDAKQVRINRKLYPHLFTD